MSFFLPELNGTHVYLPKMEVLVPAQIPGKNWSKTGIENVARPLT